MTAKQVQEGNNVAAIKSPEIPTLDVAMDKISPDFEFNARRMISVDETGRTASQIKEAGDSPKGKWTKTYRGVPEMMASLKAEGQLQPIKLRPVMGGKDGGRYSIVMGFTRYLAAQALGWQSIRAQVEALDDKTAGVQNMLENIVRDNLTPYEIAAGAKKLRDTLEVSGAELARRAGKSKAWFNNLMRVLDRVHPDLIKRWEEGHVLATTDNMNKLAALGGEEATDKERHKLQMERWDEWEGADSEEEDDEEGEKEGKPERSIKRPSTAKLKEALSAVKKEKALAKDVRELAEKCLRFAIGTLKTIPGIYDPNADEDE